MSIKWILIIDRCNEYWWMLCILYRNVTTLIQEVTWHVIAMFPRVNVYCVNNVTMQDHNQQEKLHQTKMCCFSRCFSTLFFPHYEFCVSNVTFVGIVTFVTEKSIVNGNWWWWKVLAEVRLGWVDPCIWFRYIFFFFYFVYSLLSLPPLLYSY